MLILSRKPGEKICIGNNITVTVLEVDGGRVRLGFDAPKNVSIKRGELIQIGQDEQTEPEFEEKPRECLMQWNADSVLC